MDDAIGRTDIRLNHDGIAACALHDDVARGGCPIMIFPFSTIVMVIFALEVERAAPDGFHRDVTASFSADVASEDCAFHAMLK